MYAPRVNSVKVTPLLNQIKLTLVVNQVAQGLAPPESCKGHAPRLNPVKVTLLVNAVKVTLLVSQVKLRLKVSVCCRFWLLLVHPQIDVAGQEERASAAKELTAVEDGVPMFVSQASFVDKLGYVPPLLKYIVPLTAVYLFEYFINQGLVSVPCRAVPCLRD